MASEGFARSIVPVRPTLDNRIAEAGFVFVLLLIIVGLTPFDIRTQAALVSRDTASASGDSLATSPGC